LRWRKDRLSLRLYIQNEKDAGKKELSFKVENALKNSLSGKFG
jgi:hypothetical protein